MVCGHKKSRFIKDQEGRTILRDPLTAILPTPLALILYSFLIYLQLWLKDSFGKNSDDVK